MNATARLWNHPESLLEANRLVTGFCRDNPLPAPLLQDLLLLTEEVLINIISHAYRDTRRHGIDMAIERTANRVVLKFVDDGRAFNPLVMPVAELGLPSPLAPLGGLGLTLIKDLSDEQSYERAGQFNVLTLSRHLAPEPTGAPAPERSNSLDENRNKTPIRTRQEHPCHSKSISRRKNSR